MLDIIQEKHFVLRLTLTWDVFKWYLDNEVETLLDWLTLTWDVFKYLWCVEMGG